MLNLAARQHTSKKKKLNFDLITGLESQTIPFLRWPKKGNPLLICKYLVYNLLRKGKKKRQKKLNDPKIKT